MRLGRKLLLAIAGCGLCSSAHAASIYVSGFNADEVFGAGDDPYNLANDAVSNDVDGATSYWTGAGYSDGTMGGTPVTQGLPTGTFTSASGSGVQYQLQSFSANNALRFTGTSSLVTVSPGKYSTLDILATSGSGEGLFDVVLTFSNNTTDTYTNAVSANDWGLGGNVAVSAQRTRPPSPPTLPGPVGTVTSGTWNIFESAITLSPADQALTLTGITFVQDGPYPGTQNTKATGVGNIYAINGTVATPEPASLGLLGLGGLGLLARRRRRV